MKRRRWKMVGDMVSIMALYGIFLIILGITQFALSIWAIIEIVVFDKKYKSQTLEISDIKRVSSALPLGLGLIGLILFFTVVKPAIKNDPVANKKSNLFCWIPYIVSNVLIISLFILANLVPTEIVADKISKIPNSQNSGIIDDKEFFDKDKIAERTQKAKELGKFISEEGGFAVKAQSCDNFTKQDDAKNNAIGYICATPDLSNNTVNAYIVGYTDTDEKFEDIKNVSDEELIKSALSGVGGSFSEHVSEKDFKVTNFKGMRAVEGNISNGSQHIKIITATGKKDKSGKTRTFFIATASNGDNSFNDQNFKNFADSFERL